jgi:hypothetical protein
MSHLPTERLAALADEAPTAEELSHLAGCADCAGERGAYRRLAAMVSAESARIGSPLGSWESLRPALIADGVMDAPKEKVVPLLARRMSRRWLRAAAAVVLVGGGVAGGRYSAGASLLPGRAAPPVAKNDSARADSTPHFASIEAAKAAQERSQLVYQSATTYLAERDTADNTTESVASMRARLAALDRAREVMGEALHKAPYDPVINGYYLTTVGQREATLRQINTAMPVSMQIKSY